MITRESPHIGGTTRRKSIRTRLDVLSNKGPLTVDDSCGLISPSLHRRGFLSSDLVGEVIAFVYVALFP